MDVQIENGWQFQVDDSHDWLFLRLLRNDDDAFPEPPVAARGWAIAEEHQKNRLVFELGPNTHLNSFLAGQLIVLHKRAEIDNGTFRICGFSDHDYATLKMIRVADRFPNYSSREDAVLGQLPNG